MHITSHLVTWLLFHSDMSDTDSEVVYDVAVVGAGVIGSAAACNIIRKGANVVLIEQVP